MVPKSSQGKEELIEKEKPGPKSKKKGKQSKEDNSIVDVDSKLSYRELQDKRMRERREAEELEALRKLEKGPIMGAACEDTMCGACQAIVEEFG